jgi:hypothetical protein
VENTASNTSINVKSEVKLPREVKGNVHLLMLNSKGFSGQTAVICIQ